MSVSAPVKLTIKDYKSDLHNDWCPGCVAPQTRIITRAGSAPIVDIKAGDDVLGHDGKYHRVTEVMSHWHDASMQRLSVQFLGDVVLTDDHPVWTVAFVAGLRVMSWRPAGSLKAGDVLAYPTAALSRPDLRVIPGSRAAARAPREAWDDDYVLLVVEANERLEYGGYVHNLEVEDVHSYVTEAGALHNCGDFGILTGIQMALAQLQLDPDKVACFSGIGCSGKTPHYINAYGFHTLHGRVLPVATGGRLANTDITVIALGGDGDGYGIGAGYFVNTGRRNLDFTYLVHNNNVYGLTKGQASPTLSKGKRTKSMPEQAIQDGINPIAMAVAAGYTFIARAYALEPRYTAQIIARAIQHKGSALVDVLQTCPTYNDLYTKEWYEGADLPEKTSRLYKLEERGYDGKVQDPTDPEEIVAKKAAAVARSYEREPIPIGVYYEVDLPTYEDEVFKRIPSLKDTPLAEMDTFKRDVDPLLESMR
ncbi:MAG TPA: thiamine pyrophosphate-dependent enzyme [Candidatus Limnocylindria bacterium]|nr:thiamine pyrophosphate-dependent enzyme [Candidatus Limnocylindria bacterium]